MPNARQLPVADELNARFRLNSTRRLATVSIVHLSLAQTGRLLGPQIAAPQTGWEKSIVEKFSKCKPIVARCSWPMVWLGRNRLTLRPSRIGLLTLSRVRSEPPKCGWQNGWTFPQAFVLLATGEVVFASKTTGSPSLASSKTRCGPRPCCRGLVHLVVRATAAGTDQPCRRPQSDAKRIVSRADDCV